MKKRYLIIGLSLLVLLCIVLISRSSRDAPPPEVSDLALAALDLPDAENAFTSFMDATSHMSGETRAAVEIYLADDESGRDGYTNILESSALIVAYVKQGLRREHYVGRATTNIADTAEHIMDFRALARHMCAAAGIERSEGRYSEAAEHLTACLGMTERITRRPESTIEFLVGLAGTSSALEGALELARTPEVPQPALKRLAEAIAAQHGAAEAGLVRAAKCEFRMSRNVIVDMKSGGMGVTGGLFVGLPVPKRLQTGRIPNFLLRSSETQLRFANFHRGIITNAARNRVDMDLAFGEEMAAQIKPMSPTAFLQANAIGKILFALMIPAGESFIFRRIDASAQLRATETVVALNRYRHDTESLPDRLDVLVPSYLPEVPIDPYDGQPIRYRPDADLLYVVGKDLVDDGGSRALSDEPGTRRDEDRFSRRDICWGITQPIDLSAALEAEQP